MTKKDERIFGFRTTERLNDMMRELREERGYSTDTQVVYEGINELYRKTFPAYLKNSPKSDLTPENKAKVKVQEKKINEELKREEQKEICYLLEGEVKGDSCVYYKYSGRKRFENSIPLSMLNEGMVKTQYSPNREKVEQIQAEGKAEY